MEMSRTCGEAEIRWLLPVPQEHRSAQKVIKVISILEGLNSLSVWWMLHARCVDRGREPHNRSGCGF
jgi:hypothetical protein